jgi:hypothetical protein
MARDIPVRSRVWRTLRSLEAFELSSDGAEVPDLPRKSLREDEELLGIYRNHPGSWDEAILVTDRGLHLLRSEGSTVIDYSEMQSPVGVDEKSQVQSLDIPLRGGNCVRLPVLGRRDRILDSMSFMRFLDRVRGDLVQ